jgi:N-acetylglutamate synthase/N-acetylornithine aminotransferase
VTEFAEWLAKLFVWDGEGVTKFVIIKVKVLLSKLEMGLWF